MRAVYISEHGGPEKLTYGEIPDPVIGPKEVLIQVRACGVNRADIWMRIGGVAGLELQFPVVPGADIAGVVKDVGAEVESFKAGDRVLVNPAMPCGQCEYCVRGDHGLCAKRRMIGMDWSGGYAEYTKAPEENVHLIPDHLSFDEAAAIPMPFFTAWHMLITRAQLQAGEVVLIHAAGSGIGSAGIQIAKRVGARVIATASTEAKLEKARQLGADESINYSVGDFSKRVMAITGGNGVDAILNVVGASVFEGSIASLRHGGRMVMGGFTGGPALELDVRRIMRWGFSILGSGQMGAKREVLKVMEFVRRGEFRGVVSQTFDLKDAPIAHRVMESRDLFGKLVLHP